LNVMSDADTSIANVRVGLRFGGRTREVTLKIIGMHCATCSLTVQKALLSVPGVLTANVSLASDEAKVVVDEARINYRALLKAVQRAGYDVYREEVKVYLRSLNPDDEPAIMRALSRIGVFNVGFDLTNHSVIIEYNPLDITSDELATMLRRSGFTVINVSKASEIDLDVDRRTVESDLRDILRRLVVAVPLTISIFIMMVLTMTSLIPIPLYNLLSFILATPVQFYSGWRFIKGAIRAFRNATANMDTLVALGTLSAYVFSILVLINLLPGTTFFDSSAAVITFILIGRYLEVRARLHASSAIRELARLQPRVARVIKGNAEVEASVTEVEPGDLVVVRQGEAIPVDGIVDGGEGYVDESSMSGEYMPVHRVPGDVVLAGTHLVRGYLVIRTTRNGRYTLLSQIIKLARQAQASRLPIQSLVDRGSAVFTWVVISVGILTLITWLLLGAPIYLAVMHMAAVLVVACPCALGLATPISVVVGVGRAAQKGIVIKDADALERLVRARVVAFDKTGTLTMGRPRVFSIVGDENVLALAATAEARSEHPLAKAIVENAMEKGVMPSDVSSFDSIQGMGVISQLSDGSVIAVGNERLVKGMEAELPKYIEDEAQGLRSLGYTVVYVVVNNTVRGALAIGDMVRPEAPKVISELRRLGINVVMLTGDNEVNARLIARKLGIEEVHANLLPDDKVNIINELRGKYGLIAMVGDGVNDAAALNAADVGIAMGSGSDITKEAGDVVLLRNRLDQLIDLITLSRRVLNNIKFNLIYAFLYNIVLIPIAAGVVPGVTLRPEWAGLAMAMSSISVTLNALRLRRA